VLLMGADWATIISVVGESATRWLDVRRDSSEIALYYEEDRSSALINKFVG